MQATRQEYKGYTIAVTPLKDHEDLWDFEYRIGKPGQDDPAAAITRRQSAGGHLTAEAACLAGQEVARTEVDNLLALAHRGTP